MLKISEFSKKTDFSIRMLRYLEEQGLLIATRKDNNYRFYTEEQLHEAIEIKDLQRIGFQLKEIIELRSNIKSSFHIKQLKNVLQREIDIAEIKSSTIPRLKKLITSLEKDDDNSNIFNILKDDEIQIREVPIRSDKSELKRVAYSIPFLRELYEDYLEEDSQIDLIETNVIYFKDIVNSNQVYQVFNILDQSSFMFGLGLNTDFLASYINNWKKFLSGFNLESFSDFNSSDISSLMGDYDMVIQTKFKYKDNQQDGEIVIPYTPIYTMSKFGVLK